MGPWAVRFGSESEVCRSHGLHGLSLSAFLLFRRYVKNVLVDLTMDPKMP